MSIAVPAFPTVTVTISTGRHQTPAAGTLRHNHAEQPIAAPDPERLRVGIIAYTAGIARTAGRPIQLTITEPGYTPFQLAVHPDGFTQTLTPERTIPETPDGAARPIRSAPCRRCSKPVTPLYTWCVHCGLYEPLTVLTTPPTPPTAGTAPAASEASAV